jgi:4'-phosphopantetheinyl transferase
MQFDEEGTLAPWVKSIDYPPTQTGHVAAWALELSRPSRPRITVLPALAAQPPRAPRLDDLFVWYGSPKYENLTNYDWSKLLSHLSRPERERAGRFRDIADRLSFAIAHACLRVLLASSLGCAAKDISFVVDRYGKPLLDPARHGAEAAATLHFNISHTRGLVAVAMAGRAVGVDLESPRPMGNLSAIVEQMMGPEAILLMDAAVDDSDRVSMFFRFWTLGEAFIKATGCGLAQGLKSFAFTARGKPRLLRVSEGWGPMTRWQFDLSQD